MQTPLLDDFRIHLNCLGWRDLYSCGQGENTRVEVKRIWLTFTEMRELWNSRHYNGFPQQQKLLCCTQFSAVLKRLLRLLKPKTNPWKWDWKLLLFPSELPSVSATFCKKLNESGNQSSITAGMKNTVSESRAIESSRPNNADGQVDASMWDSTQKNRRAAPPAISQSLFAWSTLEWNSSKPRWAQQKPSWVRWWCSAVVVWSPGTRGWGYDAWLFPQSEMGLNSCYFLHENDWMRKSEEGSPLQQHWPPVSVAGPWSWTGWRPGRSECWGKPCRGLCSCMGWHPENTERNLL